MQNPNTAISKCVLNRGRRTVRVNIISRIVASLVFSIKVVVMTSVRLKNVPLSCQVCLPLGVVVVVHQTLIGSLLSPGGWRAESILQCLIVVDSVISLSSYRGQH